MGNAFAMSSGQDLTLGFGLGEHASRDGTSLRGRLIADGLGHWIGESQAHNGGSRSAGSAKLLSARRFANCLAPSRVPGDEMPTQSRLAQRPVILLNHWLCSFDEHRSKKGLGNWSTKLK